VRTDISLLKKAVRLFPRTAYTSDAAVRHARRQWLKSVDQLRTGRGWVMDGVVGWPIAENAPSKQEAA
jgi:hypothetical protein